MTDPELWPRRRPYRIAIAAATVTGLAAGGVIIYFVMATIWAVLN